MGEQPQVDMTKATAIEFAVKDEPWVKYKLEDGTLLFGQVDYSQDFPIKRS